MADETYAGPIDHLVFAFPPDSRADEGLIELLALIDQGWIELLDLECLRAQDDGALVHVSVTELQSSEGPDLSDFEGADAHILDEDDLNLIAEQLEPGWIAVAVLYEERSLAEVVGTWSKAGGDLLFSGAVELEDLDEAIGEEFVEIEEER